MSINTPTLRHMSNLEAELRARLIEAQDEARANREALWQCLVLSGADTSDYVGPHRWPGGMSTPLHEVATAGVRALRADYDEACEHTSLTDEGAQS